MADNGFQPGEVVVYWPPTTRHRFQGIKARIIHEAAPSSRWKDTCYTIDPLEGMDRRRRRVGYRRLIKPTGGLE